MRGLAGLMMSLLALAGAPSPAGAPSLTGGPSLAGPPCAATTVQTLVSIDGNVAERIYRDELVGSGTIADQHQVEENGPLLKALARVSALAKDGAPVRNGVPAKGSAAASRGAPAKGNGAGVERSEKRPTRSRKRCTDSSTRTRTSCV